MIIFGYEYNHCKFYHKNYNNKIDFFIKVYVKANKNINFIISENELFYNKYIFSDLCKKFSFVLIYSKDYPYYIVPENIQEADKIVKDVASILIQKYQKGILGFLYKKIFECDKTDLNKAKYIKYLEKLYQLGSYKFLEKNGVLNDKEDYIVLLLNLISYMGKMDFIYFLSLFITETDALTDIFFNYLIYLIVNKIENNAKILDKHLYISSSLNTNNILKSEVSIIELLDENIEFIDKNYNKIKNKSLIIKAVALPKDKLLIFTKEEDKNSFDFAHSYIYKDKIHPLLYNKKEKDFFIELMSNKYNHKDTYDLFLLTYNTIKKDKNFIFIGSNLYIFFYYVFYYVFKNHKYIKLIDVYYIPIDLLNSIDFYAAKFDNTKSYKKYVDIKDVYNLFIFNIFYLAKNYKKLNLNYAKLSVYESEFYIFNQKSKLTFFNLKLVKDKNENKKIIDGEYYMSFNDKILDIKIETFFEIRNNVQNNYKLDLILRYMFYNEN